MRGAYTAGVLDYFLDRNMEFTRCYGVSAGACHACSYLSKQRGRALRVSIDYLGRRDYCSAYSLLTTGDLFNVDMIYRRIPDELDPFDYEALNRCATDFYAVVTDCQTGRAVYLPVKQYGIIAVRASSSLPLLSRKVVIEGRAYLDGGIADSIPLQKSLDDGNGKNVIVLTRDGAYQKGPTKPMWLMKLCYCRTPAFVKAAADRHLRYNQTLRLIEKEEEAGRAFVIRPQKPVELGRVEKDRVKLQALYEEGYADAAARGAALQRFLETP